ncbi:Rrf2 family transcriptional regulator [Paenibacillus protaetiae]|uniref:Rrf2 family transcriptional regulator n=1 Tax=Paenibacillus protaetiae TaxID=2509456 RepID=A0A4P6F8B1_9BACL|nr:Rrf2 family transcriptional regulator [Paenibacillus protaetiae]QAY66678.1 Rrf2 family transcriptional regulator [Paenibacillus protaetiae]
MGSNRNNPIGPPRFAIAVHTLILLAHCGCLMTSGAIAKQVNSHPTFLRRVLAQLAGEGIVEAREGRDGGYFLKADPDRLTLADIYMAVRQECTEECPGTEQSAQCASASHQIDQQLEAIIALTEQRTYDLLKQFKLSDIMNKLVFDASVK